MRLRRSAVPAAALLLLGLSTPAALAAGDPTRPDPAYDRGGAVLNILPPGSNGTYSAADIAAFEVAGTRPPNTVDQLKMYDDLNRTAPGQLTDADLTPRYYKDASLGVDPADVVSTETPRPGVRILRDKAGVPHVFGTTYGDTLYGAGYAGTEDRMFLQDTLRHVGAARAAEFLGPSASNIAMDQAQLRAAAYTKDEAAAQIANLPRRYGAEGQKLADGVNDFVAGINAAQRALCPAGLTGPRCPGEYAALQIVPADYTPADVVYIASLVGGIFGKGGGGEDQNARWLQQLQKQFGAAEGRRVFDDLREANDPEAPTTSPVPQAYGAPGPVTAGANLLPDLDAATVQRTGSRTNAAAGSVTSPGGATATSAAPDHLDGPLGPIDLSLRQHGMSNALLVDAAHSASGHPTVVFGPQTGYFAPQLLTEVDLNGPGVAARGVSFAGTQAVVELGHGVDYAWSATSSGDDNVDVVAERLCNADGSAATTASTSYLVDGVCTPMEERTHTETAKPSAGGTGLPQQLQFLVERTRHGLVQYKTTAGGVPVALVVQRSTYGGEFDSAIGFARINNPDYVKSAADFQRAFSAVDYTFNWFYADDRDISYFNSALLPRRAAGPDPVLPRDGSQTRYDWQGFASFGEHPRVTNPSTGFLVSWNNKQAPGFTPSDNEWGYGPVYRSLALSDRIAARLAGGGKMSRIGLVDAMQDAATVDVRAAYVLPAVLDVVGTDPDHAAALQLLRTWQSHGFHREDRDRDGSYSDQAAIALFDTWWESQTTSPRGAVSLPKDVLRGALGALVDQLPKGLDNHPRLGLGSAWNGVPWYGYVSKDLRQVLGRPVAGRYSRTFCGAGVLADCQAALRASLGRAVTEVARAQGRTDPASWTYDKTQDYIRSSAVGIVGVPPIDWQNRPTFQQVVGFSTHRDRLAEPGAAVPEAPLPALLPLAGAGVGLLLLLRRRRRTSAG